MRAYKKIVLTGGPCAGKTTARAYLMQKLGDLGYHVVFVPEAATLLMHGGVKPGSVFRDYAFQSAVLDLTCKLEESFGAVAADALYGTKVILIYDRGIMDGLAYVKDRDLYVHWLGNHGTSIIGARDKRYDAVLHLVTAADGAEAFYTTENNSIRVESSLEAAIQADRATQAAWKGSPHWRAIPNKGSFEDKLKHLLREICVVLGVPEPVETERKFLVAPDFNPSDFGGYEPVDIEQFYLLSGASDGGLRFRKRGQHGDSVYFETRKRSGADPSSRFETERFITAGEYEFGKQFKIPGSRFVRKTRSCFVYEHQYFELDEFEDPELPYCLLELELASPDQPMTLPPFLNIVREVTGEAEWSNFALAMRP